MDLNKFLEDLETYKRLYDEENRNVIVTLEYMIEHVGGLVEEIRLDHVQGDVDDQERN